MACAEMGPIIPGLDPGSDTHRAQTILKIGFVEQRFKIAIQQIFIIFKRASPGLDPGSPYFTSTLPESSLIESCSVLNST